MEIKIYENREMDHNDTQTVFPKTENYSSFLEACVSIDGTHYLTKLYYMVMLSFPSELWSYK